jgi:hypothetical protein
VELQQELGDMLHQGGLDLALLGLVGEAEEIKTVGVLE